MNNKDIVDLKDALVAKLDEIQKALLKILDFYQEEIKEDTIVEVHDFSSTDLNISTAEQTLNAPVFDGKRMHWFWIHIDNFDSTNDMKIGLNGDSDTGFTVKAGKSLTISYDNLKVNFVMYKAVAGTPTGQIILLRPKYQGR